MKKHLWTNLAIVLAVFSWVAGIQSLSGNMLAGEVMLLSALACRSANKRRLMEVESTNKRMIYEFVLMFAMFLLVILQNEIKDRIATDPIPNFVIPIICFVFYVVAFYKARKIEKVEEVS
jgi:cytochrome bd-type quinol oxidase subunit 2